MWVALGFAIPWLVWFGHGLVAYLWTKKHRGERVPWLRWAEVRPVLWAREVECERVLDGEDVGVVVGHRFDWGTCLVAPAGWRAWVMRKHYRGLDGFWTALSLTVRGFDWLARRGRPRFSVK